MRNVIRLTAFVIVSAIFTTPALSQRPEQGPKETAEGRNAMVSTSHPRVTNTILDVLKNGGNAVDAMITAIPLQHVLEPQMSTLAGGMGGLIYWAETGELIYLDAELDHTMDAPAARSMQRPGNVGVTSGRRIGVPGMVSGLAAAADKYGTRPWQDYFGPAIEAAGDGYPMYSFLYGEASAAFERLGAHPETRKIWMPNGFIPPVGDLVVQRSLADTLQKLAANGPEYFKSGDWAQRFVAEANRTGGTITLDEVAGYEARWVKPVEFSYKGVQMRGAPPASTAGVLNGVIFNILENFDLPASGYYADSAESFTLIRKTFAEAATYSTQYVADPRGRNVPVEQILSKSFGKHLATLISNSTTVERSASYLPLKGAPLLSDNRKPDDFKPRVFSDTNHLTIVDKDGNWVSMTHTVYGDTFGTGLNVDGVQVNSGNTFPGTGSGEGRRVITPFPALMAVNDDGEPWLAIGSPGLSERAVAITLMNLIGYGKTPYESVDAPRFTGYGRYEPMHVESRIAPDVLSEMEAQGIIMHRSAPYNWHMGSIQLVVRDAKTGKLTGVADPRRGGYAAGY